MEANLGLGFENGFVAWHFPWLNWVGPWEGCFDPREGSMVSLKTHINTFFLFVHNIEKNSLFQMRLVILVGGAQNSTIINRAGIIL